MEISLAPGDDAERNVRILVLESGRNVRIAGREETDRRQSETGPGNFVRFSEVIIQLQLAGTEQNLIRHARVDDVRQVHDERAAEVFARQFSGKLVRR